MPFFEQTATLCGWLFPGPYKSVSALAPFCIAIWPAVEPFPYSLVWFDPAAACVLCWVVELGFTPAELLELELLELFELGELLELVDFFAWPGAVFELVELLDACFFA